MNNTKEYTDFYIIYKKFKKSIQNKLNGMISRCENSSNKAYKYYGKRGIQVCSSWKDNPENFIGWCLENDYLPEKEIHRLNPHKDYEPQNCILCTQKEHLYYHRLLSKSKKELKQEEKEKREVKKILKILPPEMLVLLIKEFKTD